MAIGPYGLMPGANHGILRVAARAARVFTRDTQRDSKLRLRCTLLSPVLRLAISLFLSCYARECSAPLGHRRPVATATSSLALAPLAMAMRANHHFVPDFPCKVARL